MPSRRGSRDRKLRCVCRGGLGWEAKLLESVTDGDLAALLGVHVQIGVEAEHADCLLAVFSQGAAFTIDEQRVFTIPSTVRDELRGARWSGVPNRLSSDHHLWPVIDEVAAATEKLSRPGEAFWSPNALALSRAPPLSSPASYLFVDCGSSAATS